MGEHVKNVTVEQVDPAYRPTAKVKTATESGDAEAAKPQAAEGSGAPG